MTLLKLKEPNALNFFGIRKLKMLPPHFEYASFPLSYNLERSIEKWIVDNLKGRYYIGRDIGVKSDEGIEVVIKVGFETARELSYFNLACPLLKYH